MSARSESMEILALLNERSAYRDMAFQMQKALEEILALNPGDTDEGYNEWGEAECFSRAKSIAFKTFEALRKEYGSEFGNDGSNVKRGTSGHSEQGDGSLAGAFS